MFFGLFTQIAHVYRLLKHGAKKRTPKLYQINDREIYEDKIRRHLKRYIIEDKKIDESGYSHLACVIANALFLMWHDDNSQ